MPASVRASEAGLQKVDRARMKKGWNKQEEAWCGLASTSMATLKRFWGREAIQQPAFVEICLAVEIEDWQSIADFSITPDQTASEQFPLPYVSDESTWVERTSLRTSLLPVLQSDCRVIALTGITGIGKTDLAQRLTLLLKDSKSLRSLNLNNDEITSDFGSSGTALLRALGEEPTLEDQKDSNALLEHIVNLFRSNPYRVQIDSLERLLKGNDREGWSNFHDSLWRDLLKRILAGSNCQSQLILTTQALPGELETIGDSSHFWHHCRVEGLSEDEQLQLFQKRGISTSPATIEYLKRIGKLYEGHPLVLRVIAEDLEDCSGDVVRYWHECRFDELEANHPTQFSRHKLQLRVKQRVKDSLDRLPENARQLLCRSAVYRRPVPKEFWFALLPECNEAEQQVALRLLERRTFARQDWTPNVWLGEDESIPLGRQHNLIRSVAYELLTTDANAWRSAESKAAEMWQNAYKSVLNASNLEKIRGHLEAFYHYCNIKAWEVAFQILYTTDKRLMKEPLGYQLSSWGYFQEQKNMHERLLHQANNLSTPAKSICLDSIGTANYFMGNFSKAIECYLKCLSITSKLNKPELEMPTLINMSNAYREIGNFTEAVKRSKQGLEIARKLEAPSEEAIALCSLGQAYEELGDYELAISCYSNTLSISRREKNREGEGKALVNLGSAYESLGRYPEAMQYYEQSLAVAVELNDRSFEASVLGCLGHINFTLEAYDRAIEFSSRWLTAAREMNLQSDIGGALLNLGNIYSSLERLDEAISNYQQTLDIARKLQNKKGECKVLNALGTCYRRTGNYIEAEQHLKRSIEVARGIGSPHEEANALANLGLLQGDLNQYEDSLENLQLAESIFEKINTPLGVAHVSAGLAVLHQRLGKQDLALEYCERALKLATELGIPPTEECLEIKRRSGKRKQK